ncbi:MAG: helix-turn-helix transcriptional regulator [Proteobacteria bacterium]|nr:helix-turn-helix transcriptional regulator [Pseudomonadota bacterium]
MAPAGAQRSLPAVQFSKLAVPVVPKAQLARSAIVRAMLDADPARLVLLRAAAGFGKTSVLQQYQAAARAQGRAVLWLNLDEGDNDLSRFVAHLQAGVDQQLGAGVELVVEGAGMAQGLCQRLGAHGQPFAIVLDEFEVLQGAAALGFVQQLVDAMPAHGSLVVASRRAPALGLGRLRARGQVLEFGPAALRFSLDETASFLREQQHLQLRDADVATLHRCTEGWAAAIYLATLSLHTRSDPASFVASFSGSNLELAQYLAEDILARQSEACREFLLRTSVLDRFCAPLCDAITGRSDSAAMIDELERANLFIDRLDADGGWFRYHNLFASFLRSRLGHLHPDEPRALHRRAAQWFLGVGRAVPCVEHLLRAGAEREAVAHIAHCAPALQEAGRVRLLLRWLDRLSPEAFEQAPSLGVVHAWALALHRRQDDAMHALDRALAAPAPPAQAQRLSIEAETVRCMVLATSDRIEECCESGLALLDRIPAESSFQYGVMTNSLAYGLVSTYRYDEARQVLSRAMLRGAQRRDGIMRSVADVMEGIIDLLQGRLGNALARLQTAAERPAPGTGDATGAKASVDVSLAWALYETDALAEAEALLQGALPSVRATGPADSVITSFTLLARMAHERGEGDLSLRLLAELEQLGRDAGLPRVMCSAWLERCRLATLDGRFDAAQQSLRVAELCADWERAGVSMHANDVDTPSIARARLRMAQGDCADLPQRLRLAIDKAGAVQRHRCALKLRVLLALCEHRLGHVDEALESLDEALRMGGHEGFARCFLDEGEAFASLLSVWLARRGAQADRPGMSSGFIDTLRVRCGLPADLEDPLPAGDAESLQAAGSAENLSGREFQVLRLLAEGHRNKAIAEKLFLSEFTVKSHLRNINAKLAADSRTAAVAIARRRGLIA